MNILLTGKLDSIATHLISAAGSNRVILAAEHIPTDDLPNNVRPFNIKADDPLFQRVIRVGSFDVAVFFLARGEQTDKNEGGVTSFQSMLEFCIECGIGHIVLVSSGEVYSGLTDSASFSESTATAPKGTQGYQIKAAEDMCVQHWQNSAKNITVVRLPYVYRRDDPANGDGLLANLFAAVQEGRGKFELPGSPETNCDFLSDVEAARLIWLVIDEGASSKSVFVNAGTGKPSTFADFSNLVGRHFPDLSIKYSGDDADVPPPMRTGIARSEYGWNSLYSFSDDFPGMVKRITAVPVKRFLFVSKFFNAAGSFFKGSKGFIVLEFIAATVLLHFLSTGLRKFTFSSWIDLRLLFVVILSTLHGTISGIASGIIAGIMLFLSMGSSDWRILVYNPENWIPFALYIILGVSLGSKADRNVDSLKFTEERLALAEQTNVYLVELYDEAVRIKDNYRDQILGYKDNFGRIYTIVKKLNSEMSEYVFSSAIEVLEDVLSNNTIAIYSLSSNGDYARITVSSKNLHGEIARSMRLKDYQRITEKLEQHDIWFNRDLISGYPSYCAPVYNDEKLIAMVMIWRAGVEQMTLHYSNLFRILSGLIQESLVRAVKFNKLRESTSFYPDTRILYKEPFIEAYKANLTLSDQDKAKFCLLTVNRGGEDVNAQNIRLEACIRESDIAGTVNDGLFGIILKNVTNDDIQTLLNRFSSNNLDARQVTIAQMHELVFGEA